MEIRKIFRAGNSYVISLPRRILAELGPKEGSRVVVEFNREQELVTLRPINERKTKTISK